MIRSSLKRNIGEVRKQAAVKRCKAPKCRNAAMPYRAFCSPDCGAILGLAAVEKAKRLEAKRERMADGIKREQMKTFPMLLKEVKEAMHEWVRLRDRIAGHGCISCNRPLVWGAVGGMVDAGHYRSVGSAAHLRFDERNVHAQCVYCNRDNGGNPHGYRPGLIERIGLQAVIELEADQAPRNYTKDDLRALRTMYRARVRDMKKGIE